MTNRSVPRAFTTPRWMQSLHYTLDPLGYLSKAYARCGDIFHAPIIGSHRHVVLVSDPGALKAIFTSDTKEIFAPANQLLQPITGDRSIFGLENQRHRRERKLLMPPFHRDQIPKYGTLIRSLTLQALASIQPGETFIARVLMQDIALDVILTVVFGLREGARFRQLKQLIMQLTDALQNPGVAVSLFQPVLQKQWPATPWSRFLALHRQISQLLYEEIRDRRQQPLVDAIDILSLLMQAEDEAGQPMSDPELHDELMTLLLAGNETTASALSWAIYWIHRDRRVYDTLMEELATAGEDPMAIAQLPYLNAVCHETLRIYPVAMLTVPREVREPIHLLGYPLEPGTRLYGAIYLTHHRADLYPDSDTFRPERFLDRQYSNFEFLPFGGGARRCIGEVLAQFEMRWVLAALLKQGTFQLQNSQPEIPKRRGVTLAPGSGVPLLRLS